MYSICGPTVMGLEPPSSVTSWHSLNQTSLPQAGPAFQEAGRAWSAEAVRLSQLIFQLILRGLPWWWPAAFFHARRWRPVTKQPALQQQDQGPHRRPHKILHTLARRPQGTAGSGGLLTAVPHPKESQSQRGRRWQGGWGSDVFFCLLPQHSLTVWNLNFMKLM